MVLLPLVPRPLGSLTLLLRALHGHATTAIAAVDVAGQVDVAGPVDVAGTVDVALPEAPGLPPAGAPPSTDACEAESKDEQDAALALRFGFHV